MSDLETRFMQNDGKGFRIRMLLNRVESFLLEMNYLPCLCRYRRAYSNEAAHPNEHINLGGKLQFL